MVSKITANIAFFSFIMLYINQFFNYWAPPEKAVNLINGYLVIYEIFYWLSALFLLGLGFFLAFVVSQAKEKISLLDNYSSNKLIKSCEKATKYMKKPWPIFIFWIRISFMVFVASASDWSLFIAFLISLISMWMIKSFIEDISKLKPKSIIGEEK